MNVILDYGIGNIRSLVNACEELGYAAELCSEPERAANADRIILPGVGAIGVAMRRLKQFGLDNVLIEKHKSGTPIFGVCLGMQMLCQYSDESGGTDGLGLFAASCRRFELSPEFKVPHIGWNDLMLKNAHPVLADVPDGSDVYFVHSYFVDCENDADILASTEYGGQEFCSIFGTDNLVGMQFHPEKSQAVGLRLLANFFKL